MIIGLIVTINERKFKMHLVINDYDGYVSVESEHEVNVENKVISFKVDEEEVKMQLVINGEYVSIITKEHVHVNTNYPAFQEPLKASNG